jgi:hypothetical protein
MEYRIVMLTTEQEVGVWKDTEWVYETSLAALTSQGWRLFHVGTWVAVEWRLAVYEAIVVLQRPEEGIAFA